MTHNRKGNTHIDLHLSSSVYTDKPILSSYHLDKLKNWGLFSVNGVTLWQPAQIFFSVSIEHHGGRNVLFRKTPHDGRFKRRISYDCQRILMNIYKLVKKSEGKNQVIHNASSWTKAEPHLQHLSVVSFPEKWPFWPCLTQTFFSW